MQTFSVSLDWSLAGLFSQLGWTVTSQTPLAALWNVKLSQAAPVLPYLLMVLLLIFRPRGLMGTREG
jgi:branched-chain amino acid transport system permease protein